MAIDLSSVNDIPQRLIDKLKPFDTLFKQNECQDPILDHPEIVNIVLELNTHAIEHGVVGYHYTRSIASSIEEKGLIIQTGKQRRQLFLQEHRDIFTPEQIDRLNTGWSDYFKRNQNAGRDNRLWFNLTNHALSNGGASALLHNYGGEVVYMPFARDKEITAILNSLGEPLLVKCDLDTQNLNTFSTEPWGKVQLSSYHKSINPDVYRVDYDVFAELPVSPDQITEIIRL